MFSFDLEGPRRNVFSSPDADLFLHVGYLMTWYTQAEWRVTVLMAMVAEERDFEAFHVLVQRMDAKTKVQRFRELCKVKKRTIGPGLDARLKFFSNKLSPLRYNGPSAGPSPGQGIQGVE